jgi:hypothetical protein
MSLLWVCVLEAKVDASCRSLVQRSPTESVCHYVWSRNLKNLKVLARVGLYVKDEEEERKRLQQSQWGGNAFNNCRIKSGVGELPFITIIESTCFRCRRIASPVQWISDKQATLWNIVWNCIDTFLKAFNKFYTSTYDYNWTVCPSSVKFICQQSNRIKVRIFFTNVLSKTQPMK